MARTSITVTNLSRDDAIDSVAAYQAADATNGMQVPAGVDGKLFLHVKNGGAGSITVTIRKGVHFRSDVGDLAVSVPAGGERMIGPLESSRFEQADENLYVDFSADSSVTVAAFRLP